MLDPVRAAALSRLPGDPGCLAPDARRPYPCIGHLFTVRKAADR